MLQILTITAPIYLLIAVGYLAVRQGVFKREDMRTLGKLLVLFSMPALVFRAIGRQPLHEVFKLEYLAVYGLGSLLMWIAGWLYARQFRQASGAAASVTGMGMSASNSVFVGYPIISQLIGPSADTALALCLLVENLLIIPLTLTLCENNPNWPRHKALLHSFKNLLKNPIFLAIVAGFVFSAFSIPITGVLDRTLQIGASAASPVALFMIGGILVGQPFKGLQTDIAAISIGKLLLHPLAVIAMAWLIPGLTPAMRQAAILFACMPIPSVYTALAQKYDLDGFAATMLIVTTVLSFLTLNTWIWALA